MTSSSFQCILSVKRGEYCAGVSSTFVVVKIRIDEWGRKTTFIENGKQSIP